MREIKFRGRDGDDWYYGSLFVNECGHTAISAPKSFWMKPVNAETVGQFTGLLDSNGREIYEGDILQNKHARYIVKYDEGEFVVVEITTRAILDKTGLHWEDIEKSVQPLKDVLDNVIDDYKIIVVGNIHDNIIVRDGAR